MVRWGHCHVFIFYMLTGVCLIVFFATSAALVEV